MNKMTVSAPKNQVPAWVNGEIEQEIKKIREEREQLNRLEKNVKHLAKELGIKLE